MRGGENGRRVQGLWEKKSSGSFVSLVVQFLFAADDIISIDSRSEQC